MMKRGRKPKPQNGDPQQLLTVEEAADILRCSSSTLSHWRISGIGPRYVKIGGRVRYARRDLATYVEAQTRLPVD